MNKFCYVFQVFRSHDLTKGFARSKREGVHNFWIFMEYNLSTILGRIQCFSQVPLLIISIRMHIPMNEKCRVWVIWRKSWTRLEFRSIDQSSPLTVRLWVCSRSCILREEIAVGIGITFQSRFSYINKINDEY